MKYSKDNNIDRAAVFSCKYCAEKMNTTSFFSYGLAVGQGGNMEPFLLTKNIQAWQNFGETHSPYVGKNALQPEDFKLKLFDDNYELEAWCKNIILMLKHGGGNWVIIQHGGKVRSVDVGIKPLGFRVFSTSSSFFQTHTQTRALKRRRYKLFMESEFFLNQTLSGTSTTC